MTEKINLFVLGFPRSGTTSLVTLLKQSKDVRFTNPKEPHYFCKDFHKLSKDMHGVVKCFKVKTADEYKDSIDEYATCNGDGSTSYIYSKEAPKNVFEYNSNAKFIVTIRDPISFLKSWHNYLYQRGEVNNRSLKKHLIAIKEQQLDKVVNKKRLCHIKRADYLDLIKYSDHIERWVETFHKDQVKIILFEEFISNPQKTIDELCQFIGISQYAVKEEKQYNSALYVKLMHNNVSRNMINVLRKILPDNMDKKKLLKLLRVFDYKYSTESNDELYQLIKSEYDQVYHSASKLYGGRVQDYWHYTRAGSNTSSKNTV